MKFETIKCNSQNIGNKRSYDSIKYIVIHYTANKNDRAISNAKYFANNVVKASAHYFVDADNTIYKSCPVNRVGYSVGGSKYVNTKGAKYYGKCTNANSISIEMCDSVTRNKEVEANTIELVKFLMNKYNIPKSNVIRHYDVTGKICPKPYIDEKVWKEFKSKL